MLEIVFLLSVSLIVIIYLPYSRKASDVCLDLLEIETQQEVSSSKKTILNKFIFFNCLISIVLGYFFNPQIAICSFLVAFILKKQLLNRKNKKEKLLIGRVLPLTMERLVMAIEAGNDVLSACRIIVEQDKKSKQRSNRIVSKHIESVITLAENGLSFTESLKRVSKQVSGTALSQTFIHLSLAYQQGGELIGPLQELSNATQLAYQETVEEEIAKLPVKATLPLILIFAGLILFFITPPLLEVQKLTSSIQSEI